MVGFFKQRQNHRDLEYIKKQKEIDKKIKDNASKCEEHILAAADQQADVLAPQLGKYLGQRMYKKIDFDNAIYAEIKRGYEEKRRFKRITFIECLILIILIFM